MLAIDRYAYINKLRYFNDDIKLLFFIIMIALSLFISNSYIHLVIFFIMSFIVLYIAKIPLNAYLKIYLIPLSFIFLSILAFIFNISDTNINSLFSIKMFNFFIVIRSDSLLRAITLTTRAISAISCSYFLILTTPFNNLIKLLTKYKVPTLLIELTMLTYRFIFILLEEISEIYRAQDLKFGYNNIKNSFNSLGLLLRILIVRIIKRYEEMTISLESKNYDNSFYM